MTTEALFERARSAQQAVNDMGAGKYGDSTLLKHRSDTNGPCLACEQRNKRVDIRTTHWAGYRNGQWARVTGLTWMSERACYTVLFDDGAIDYWPVLDPAAGYEFRLSTSHG